MMQQSVMTFMKAVPAFIFGFWAATQLALWAERFLPTVIPEYYWAAFGLGIARAGGVIAIGILLWTAWHVYKYGEWGPKFHRGLRTFFFGIVLAYAFFRLPFIEDVFERFSEGVAMGILALLSMTTHEFSMRAYDTGNPYNIWIYGFTGANVGYMVLLIGMLIY